MGSPLLVHQHVVRARVAHVDAGRGSSDERDDGGLGALFRFLYRDMYRRGGADDDVDFDVTPPDLGDLAAAHRGCESQG